MGVQATYWVLHFETAGVILKEEGTCAKVLESPISKQFQSGGGGPHY